MSEEDTSASVGRNSPPLLPPDSPGSSVSTRLQEEYSELLKYTLLTTGQESGTFQEVKGSPRGDFPPITRSNGASARLSPVEHGATGLDVLPPPDQRDKNSNSVYPACLPSFDSLGPVDIQGDQKNAVENANSFENDADFMAGDTSESQITEHSILDPAVARMGHKLDNWLGKLKADILGEYSRSAAESLHAQRQLNQRELNQLISEKKQLERDVNRLSEQISTCEQSMSRKDSLIQNLTQSLSLQKDRVQMAQAFYKMKGAHLDGQREKFTEQLAALHYQRQLTQRVLKGWFGLVQARWRTRIERQCQDQAQTVCKHLTTDYETKIGSLNNTIGELEGRIASLQQEREQYAESVKKAFMRGVCALNMEAMSAFISEDANTNIDESIDESSRVTDMNSFPPAASDCNAHSTNVCSSLSSKEEHQSKPVLADRVVTFVPDKYPDPGQHHLTADSCHQSSHHKPLQSKVKNKKDKSRVTPSTTSSSHLKTSSRPILGVQGQGQPLAPPMASIVVERHQPITKQQTVGKATASRFPRPNTSENSRNASKATSGPSVSWSQPLTLVGQTFKPLAGQTEAFQRPTVNPPPSIKVVE